MWQDSCRIFMKNFERFGWKPLYEQCDIDKALSHIVECNLHDKICINDNIKQS